MFNNAHDGHINEGSQIPTEIADKKLFIWIDRYASSVKFSLLFRKFIFIIERLVF